MIEKPNMDVEHITVFPRGWFGDSITTQPSTGCLKITGATSHAIAGISCNLRVKMLHLCTQSLGYQPKEIHLDLEKVLSAPKREKH